MGVTRYPGKVAQYAIEFMKLDNEYVSLIECEAGDAEVDFDRASQVVEQKAVICELLATEVLLSMGYRFECDGTLLGRWARKVEPAAES